MENIFQTVNDIQQSPLWGLAWKFLWFSIAIIWVSLILWTLKDARKRIDDGLIIGVAVATSLVFPFIGTLVYTILRPSEYLADAQERELEMAAMEQSLHQTRTCPKCEEPVLDGFIICPDVGGSCVVFAGLVGSPWSSIGRFVPIACMTVVGRLKIMRLVPALKSGKGQRTDLAALGVVAGIASVGFFCSVHPWLSNRVA